MNILVIRVIIETTKCYTFKDKDLDTKHYSGENAKDE